MALGRLPSLAIRLSVPRRPRDGAGKPPSRRDARQPRLLGRRGRSACSCRHDARERAERAGRRARSPPQLDQLADLICRGGAQGRTQGASYTLPMYKIRQHRRSRRRRSASSWCPPDERKRPIDLVLLSIGGNDVGFGALALMPDRERARHRADREPGRQRDPLRAGGVAHLSRRARQAHQGGARCAGRRLRRRARRACCRMPMSRSSTTRPAATAARSRRSGMDVHPSLKVSKARLQEVVRLRERATEAARMHVVDQGPPTARPASRPAPAPASASSPTTSRTSPSAASARAIRRGRCSTRSP